MTSRDPYQPLINEFSHWIADKSPSSTYWCSFLFSNGLYRSGGPAQELIEAYTPIPPTTSIAAALGTQEIPLTEEEATMKFFYEIREDDSDMCLSLMSEVYFDFSENDVDFDRYPELERLEDEDIESTDVFTSNIEYGGRTEKFYEGKNKFDVYVDIQEELQEVDDEVFIVDPYVSEELVEDYLRRLPKYINIRILTREDLGEFDTVAARFNDDEGRWLQVRKHNEIHDRYIFIDDSGLVIGNSITNAGEKPTHMIKIGKAEEVKGIYDDMWDEANQVPYMQE